jgi:hypothetical protein
MRAHHAGQDDDHRQIANVTAAPAPRILVFDRRVAASAKGPGKG